MIYNFIEFHLKKFMKKSKGGKIVMPLEYFGVETNHFVQQPQFQSSNANISFIRPPMNMLDISMTGGNKKVNFSSKIFLSAIDEISNKLNTPVEKKLEMSKKLKEKF